MDLGRAYSRPLLSAAPYAPESDVLRANPIDWRERPFCLYC